MIGTGRAGYNDYVKQFNRELKMNIKFIIIAAVSAIIAAKVFKGGATPILLGFCGVFAIILLAIGAINATFGTNI